MEKELYTAQKFIETFFENIKIDFSKKNKMYQGWSSIVGEKLYERSSIEDIENGCLIIRVRDGSTKQLLMLKKQEILYKISKNYPGIKIDRIKFHLSN